MRSGWGSGVISYNTPWIPGAIGSPTATLRQISGATNSSSLDPTDGCEDVVTATKLNSITAAIGVTSGSASFAATAAAFEGVPSGVARHARDHGWR